MRIGLSTAPLAFRLRGAGGSAVDNPTEQGFHLRNPKTCPNKPGHLLRNAWHLDLVQWIQRHTPSIISWGMAVRP